MKRLYMLAITSLLMAACAEDTEMNRENSPLISFSVSDPAAVAEPQSHPSSAATRTYQAPDVFTPGNSLFGDSIYTNPVPQTTPQQARWHQEPLKGDYPEQLCMLVSQEQWHPQAATPAAGRTRAVETTQSALNANGQAIQVNAAGLYTGQATYSSASSKFEPNTATAWPTTGSSSTAYDIYAWHPTTFTSTGISMSGQTFTYTLPTTSAAMVDLIGTKESHSYSENNDGSISLTFNHLLAPVCFKLAAGVKGTITSIKFSSIVTTGTYTLGATHADDATYGYTWTASTTGEYTATVSGTGGASEVQVDGSHYFMMIPQTVAAGVVVTITITDGASQSNTLTYTVPSGGQVWKAGQVTTYTISQTAVTSLSLTYPQWTLSGGSTTTYGPVDNYDVTTENYGYVGLFAVDKYNKIVISNAKVKITSAANHIGTCDLTAAANTAVLGNYILSQNYTYYVMYPYSTSATGLSTLAAGNTSPGSDADTFFANVTANWSVQNDQSSASNFRTSDLQIAKGTGSSARSFTMTHKMGLVDVSIASGGRLTASNLVNAVNIRMIGTLNNTPYRALVSSTAHAYTICSPQNVSGNYANVYTDEQSKSYSASFSITSGKYNAVSITYDVKLPIDYVALGNIQSNTKNGSGQWVINTNNNTTSSGYYWFSVDNFTTRFGDYTKGMLCNDGKTYHVATKQEYVSIVPCISHETNSSLYDWTGAKTETQVRFGRMTSDKSYTSYWSKNGLVLYAIRFVGTIYCSAWRYEWSSDASIGGGGEIIKVKYLGSNITTSNAASTLTSSKSYNWNASDIVVRKFPATGFRSYASGEGNTGTSETGTRVRHISASSAGYITTYSRYVWWELMFGLKDGSAFAWVEDWNSWHSGTNDPRTVRLFLDEN